ncbi:hypothetical protein EJB05_19823, partial [Eragrostis curvula]
EAAPPKNRRESDDVRGGRVGGRQARGRRTGARGSFRGPVWKEKAAATTESTVPRKRSSPEAGVDDEKEEELRDTASSPLKAIPEEEGAEKIKSAAHRKLALGTEGDTNVPPPPPKYVSPRELKKSRREAANIVEAGMGSYGHIVQEIRARATGFSNVEFVHENRASNVDAHNLARGSIFAALGRHVWFLSPPDGVCNTYHIDT